LIKAVAQAWKPILLTRRAPFQSAVRLVQAYG
jgi:hypothetical protein